MKNLNGSNFSTHLSGDFQQLNQLNNKLRDLTQGIPGISLPLPRIVSCGDQSSGKSSILSQITGLRFPRSQGLCTRVPIELRLEKTNGKESCHCSINWIETKPNDAQKTAIQEINEDLKQPGDIISAIEKAISKLQDVISEQKFSKDTIVIQVKSPSVPPLTLVDLPGLVAFSAHDKNAKEKIKDMYDEYLADESTIIMAVVALNSDIETQSIWKHVQEYDKDLSRTVGVLSKSDLIENGTHKEKFGVALGRGIVGERVHLKQGWYFTKTRSHEQRDLSQEEILKVEKDFFNTGVWEAFDNPEYLGSTKLLQKITRLMFSLFVKVLPKVQDNAMKQLLQAQNELKACGVIVPGERLGRIGHLKSLVGDYCGALSKQLISNSQELNEKIVLSKCRELWTKLDHNLKETVPSPYETKKTASHYQHEQVIIGNPIVYSKKSFGSHCIGIKAPKKSEKYFLGFSELQVEDWDDSHCLVISKGKVKLDWKFVKDTEVIYENHAYKKAIANQIEIARDNQGKMHGEHPDQVIPGLIDSILKQWEPLTHYIFQTIYGELRKIIKNSLSVFGQWINLKETVEAKVEDVLHRFHEICKLDLDLILRKERNCKHTLNTHYLTDTQMSMSTNRVTIADVELALGSNAKYVPRHLKEMMRVGMEQETLKKRSWSKDVDDVFKLVVSYCKVSRKSYSDQVMKSMFSLLFVDVLKEFETKLFDHLIHHDLALLFTEDEGVLARRENLLNKQRAMENVIEVVRSQSHLKQWLNLEAKVNAMDDDQQQE